MTPTLLSASPFIAAPFQDVLPRTSQQLVIHARFRLGHFLTLKIGLLRLATLAGKNGTGLLHRPGRIRVRVALLAGAIGGDVTSHFVWINAPGEGAPRVG